LNNICNPMKNVLTIALFFAAALPVYGQVSLYGQYKTGQPKEAVEKLDRSLRLNGMYYFIEPDFDQEDKLIQIRMINYDYVSIRDHNVVRNRAKGLVDLMAYKFGSPGLLDLDQPLNCRPGVPNPVAVWENAGKIIVIDIACAQEDRYHLVLTVKANSQMAKAERKAFRLAEN